MLAGERGEGLTLFSLMSSLATFMDSEKWTFSSISPWISSSLPIKFLASVLPPAT